jgi:hypothetical protein
MSDRYAGSVQAHAEAMMKHAVPRRGDVVCACGKECGSNRGLRQHVNRQRLKALKGAADGAREG